MPFNFFKLFFYVCRRKSEELQFRLEEEAIEKTTLENQKSDVEERIFELEEALAAAKETNERMETQLNERGTSLEQPATGHVQSSPVDGAKLAAAEARISELEAVLVQMQEEQLIVRTYIVLKPSCCFYLGIW